MIDNILHSKRIWLLATAVAVLAGSFAVAAQADHHKGKKKRHHGNVVTEMEGKGFLGVQMQELSDEMREGLNVDTDYGVLISTVIDDSPADKAGLEEGDIVVRFDGKKVESPDQLRELVAETEVGSEVKMKIIRDNKEKTLDVTIGEWSDFSGFDMGNFKLDNFEWEDMPQFVHALMPRRLGVNVSGVDENLAPYFGVDEGDGLLVLSVSEDSMAEEMGVKSGDIITEIAGESVKDRDDVHEALHAIDEGETFDVKVIRQKKTVALEGTMREDDTSVRVRNAFRFHDGNNMHFSPKKMHGHDTDTDELRVELDELRKELDELKSEMKKSRRR